MLTLYYSPGACSMAPHIALEEAGAPYALHLVSIPKGEHQAPEYLQNVNPRGKVPALRTDDGVLTENVAILTYIARSFPHAKLLPEEPIGMARCLEHMAYLSNTVHPVFTNIVRPGRFATDEAAHANLRVTGRENAWKLLQSSTRSLPAGSGCWARVIRSPIPTRSSFTAGAKGTVCRSRSFVATPASRTACCSARRFGQCSNARRASCSRADQVGLRALGVARKPGSSGWFGGAFRNTVRKSMRLPQANRRGLYSLTSIQRQRKCPRSRWFHRC
jgi:glutathione S-transferase-like protein